MTAGTAPGSTTAHDLVLGIMVQAVTTGLDERMPEAFLQARAVR